MSTPQMICVTVTFLVSATECHATVRSCVTWAAVPGLSGGEKSPQDEREPSARGGTDPSVPPPQQSQPNNCRSSRDTRMTRFGGVRERRNNGKSEKQVLQLRFSGIELRGSSL